MLALVGSGEYLPEMDPVDRVLLAELGSHPTVACLPTAAGTEGTERIEYWSTLGVDHFTRLGADAHTVPVITRQDAQNIDLAEQISPGGSRVFVGRTSGLPAPGPQGQPGLAGHPGCFEARRYSGRLQRRCDGHGCKNPWISTLAAGF